MTIVLRARPHISPHAGDNVQWARGGFAHFAMHRRTLHYPCVLLLFANYYDLGHPLTRCFSQRSGVVLFFFLRPPNGSAVENDKNRDHPYRTEANGLQFGAFRAECVCVFLFVYFHMFPSAGRLNSATSTLVAFILLLFIFWKSKSFRSVFFLGAGPAWLFFWPPSCCMAGVFVCFSLSHTPDTHAGRRALVLAR